MAGAVAAVLACILYASGSDAWIADRLYRWQGGRWALRDAWWTSAVLHEGGRRLSILCWLAVLSVWACSGRCRIGVAWRRPLGYLLVSVLASTLLVSMLKHVSGIDCPWDLQRYGGTRPEGLWFADLPVGDTDRGACFPAGHASAGYAWVAVWFALAAVRPAWRQRGLMLVLLTGVVFGAVQQLRGAHFLSHDLGTLALCVLVAGMLARIWPWQAAVLPVGQPAQDRVSKISVDDTRTSR